MHFRKVPTRCQFPAKTLHKSIPYDHNDEGCQHHPDTDSVDAVHEPEIHVLLRCLIPVYEPGRVQIAKEFLKNAHNVIDSNSITKIHVKRLPCNLRKGLLQVFQQVVDILYSHAQAQQGVGEAGFQAFFARNAGMGHGSRVAHQAFHSAQAFGQ